MNLTGLTFNAIQLQCTKIFLIDLSDATLTDTECTGVAGTSRYRAPEVTMGELFGGTALYCLIGYHIKGLPWDGAVDWFAAGCVVVEIASGRALFPSTSSRKARLAAVVAVLGPIPDWMGRRITRWCPTLVMDDAADSFRVRRTRRNVREAVEYERISRLRSLEVSLNEF